MPKRSLRRLHRSLPPTPQTGVLSTLSSKQKQLLAEILGNLAVAWFMVGVISPMFLKPVSLPQLIPSVGASVLISVFFVYLALRVIKEPK